MLTAAIINVASLFSGSTVFPVAGDSLLFFTAIQKHREIIYIAGLIILTVFLSWKAEAVVRSTNHDLAIEFRELLIGIVLIVGVAAAIAVPYLFHNKKFEENVL